MAAASWWVFQGFVGEAAPDSISIILFITLSGRCCNEIGSEQHYDDRKRRLGPCQTYFISGAQRCDIDMHGYRDNG
ncbi:MAG: hypothetical protein WB988_09270 [Candidatus Nitrosopolaris sp.]